MAKHIRLIVHVKMCIITTFLYIYSTGLYKVPFFVVDQWLIAKSRVLEIPVVKSYVLEVPVGKNASNVVLHRKKMHLYQNSHFSFF